MTIQLLCFIYLHGIDGCLPELPVVLNRNISPLLELKAGIHRQLLAGGLTEGLGPLGLPGVLLLLEIFVAFSPTEVEHFAVVSHELDPFAHVDTAAAEIAALNTHAGPTIALILQENNCNKTLYFMIPERLSADRQKS